MPSSQLLNQANQRQEKRHDVDHDQQGNRHNGQGKQQLDEHVHPVVQAPAVAVGFRAKKSNGKYRYFWLYRVVFSVPDTELNTKEDKISPAAPTIEGTIMRRNKVDACGKHPWKAQVDEDDASVSAATITDWFKTVYEPVYNTTP